jgi:hypothetical protein
MGEQNAGGGSGDALYALGVFGAATYFWQRADGPKGKTLAVLKGMVWPAFLVHAAFELLEDQAEVPPPDAAEADAAEMDAAEAVDPAI